MALIEATRSGMMHLRSGYYLSKPVKRTSYKLHFGIKGVPATRYKSLLSVSFEDFQVLLSLVKPTIKFFFMKLRLNLSQKILLLFEWE